MKSTLSFLAGLLLSLCSFAQNDSCHLRLSILTCGAGEDLYTVFGHTAVRVTDSVRGTDIIYNYGTFDFEDPDFYIKFIKGKMLYFVSAEPYRDFVQEYRLDGRSIIEQELWLSCQEKIRLSRALETNAKPENKYYFYQFLFDNCSTRVRDIVKANTESAVTFDSLLRHPMPSFRTLLHADLDRGKQPWSKLGIDLSLGSLIDRPPTNEELMFLPEYLFVGFDKASTGGHRLVLSTQTILAPTSDAGDVSLLTPFNIFAILFLVIVSITLLTKRLTNPFLNVFDIALFLLVGGSGAFLVFLWFGTGHDLTADNYNLLWALPTHLIMAFFVLKNRRWVRLYFTISFIISCLVIVFWKMLPQGMNPAFIPLVLLIGFRCLARSSFVQAVKK